MGTPRKMFEVITTRWNSLDNKEKTTKHDTQRRNHFNILFTRRSLRCKYQAPMQNLKSVLVTTVVSQVAPRGTTSLAMDGTTASADSNTARPYCSLTHQQIDYFFFFMLRRRRFMADLRALRFMAFFFIERRFAMVSCLVLTTRGV